MIDYQTELIESNNIVVVRVKGKPKTKETRKMGCKMRPQAKLTNKKLILDFSKADIFKISVLDAHMWFKDYYDKLDTELRNVKTALLPNQKNIQLYKLIELSWTDQGILTKPCQNIELAQSWLDNPAL